MINKSMLLAMTCGLSLAFMSCENQKFNDTYADAERVHLDTLSAEMQKVRDYVPELAVVAHRGSTYWAPEETESAYRWRRNPLTVGLVRQEPTIWKPICRYPRTA